MQKLLKNFIHQFMPVVFTAAFVPPFALAQTNFDYAAPPAFSSETTAPLIMLAMSVDHQLFFKAFTDYEDVTGDGLIDTSYSNSFDYAGYFGTDLCYVYDTTNKRYKPSSKTKDHYCNKSGNNEWSGNFLNWATMTRIDEVRLMLYGGLRSTDTDSLTVLERSYLPNDAHSFAKYYNGTDLKDLTPFASVGTGTDSQDSGITICNTTLYKGNSLSQVVTEPPLARVVVGNYSLWAANERWQCLYQGEYTNAGTRGKNNNDSGKTGINAYNDSPSITNRAPQVGTTVPDYVVRVEVCGPTLQRGNDEGFCKKYPKGNFKPTGLLQKHGENDSALWGLMSGSYKKNKSGGVLRKDISSITNEINIASDGSFKTLTSDFGIISALNSLRIVNYAVQNRGTINDGDSDGVYNISDSCKWGSKSFIDGECTNWGNPFAEIMLECYRYFAGADPDSAFHADDTSLLPNLKTDTAWNNPQDEDTRCASLNVIAFNASAISYDGDQLGKTGDLATTLSAQALTNMIGVDEGIASNKYFVGQTATSTDQLCTAKTVTNLGEVAGTCPDSPRLGGTYNVAGLAYQAHTNDLRSDLEDDQTVKTFGVTLAPGVPQISILVPGTGAGTTVPAKYVSILPACHNKDLGGNCGLVDFKVVSQSATASTAEGKFYVNWEDTEQGGDYDQDMSGTIEYSLNSSNGTIVITTNVFSESTKYKMGFGYVVGGTTDDGFHVQSGIEGFTEGECNNCQVGNLAVSKTFDLGVSTASLLEQPLFYASKWGGFTKERDNQNDKPDLAYKWDRDGDGLPDNYVSVTDPAKLKETLDDFIGGLVSQVGAGSSAAVNAQSGTGQGSIIQAVYTPTIEVSNEKVNWVGTLRSFFVDKYGRIREDRNRNGVLEQSDRIVEFIYVDGDPPSLEAQVYAVNADGSRGAQEKPDLKNADVQPIWSAEEGLASLINIKSNRATFNDDAGKGRYIFTAIDRDGDGNVIQPQYTDRNPGRAATSGGSKVKDAAFAFVYSNFVDSGDTANDYRYFDFGTNADTENLVNFIRGDETIDGFRNRTLGGVKRLLGDIVSSSPVVVGSPSDRYDLIYGDESYKAFREKYKNRRVVTYVGANDGMVHAFNGGFYDADTVSYTKTIAVASGASAPAAHPLGAELWAYVPYNLLPHLKWLTSPNYTHVFYVDGPMKTFDVNIFPDDAEHPGGWGTILVASMRFGGGEYSLDHDGDGNLAKNIVLRSSYMIFDVTDPETPPDLIAEITDEDLGYTTSDPTVVKSRAYDYDTNGNKGQQANKWYLMFGSGPIGSATVSPRQVLNAGVSGRSAKVFTFDLKDPTSALQKTELKDELGKPEANSFVGGFTAADWDTDYQDDVVYFGTISGGPFIPGGKLKRATLKFTGNGLSADYSNDLFNDMNRAFSAPPTVFRAAGDQWVFAGTGRFLVPRDNLSGHVQLPKRPNTQQQYYFGIKEPLDANGGLTYTTTVDNNSLVETTNVNVLTDGSLKNNSGASPTVSANGQSETVDTFLDLQNFVKQHGGWKFQLQSLSTGSPAPDTAVRTTTRPAIIFNSLLISAYRTTGQACDPIGDGLLYAPDLTTGVPAAFALLGTKNNGGNSNPSDIVNAINATGKGALSNPLVNESAPEPGKNPPTNGSPPPPPCYPSAPSLKINTSVGTIHNQQLGCPQPNLDRAKSWRELPVTQ